jgi:hypothetical protein
LPRHHAGGDRFAVESKPHRLLLRGAIGIRRPNRKTVHIGPVEARNVYRRSNIFGEDAPKSVGQRHGFGTEPSRPDHFVPTLLGLVPIKNIEELLLLHPLAPESGGTEPPGFVAPVPGEVGPGEVGPGEVGPGEKSPGKEGAGSSS